MKDPETDRLVDEMNALPDYEGWSFSYEYPGYFCYHHRELPYRVAFTPDWEGDEQLPIQVEDEGGHFYEEHSPVLPLPREGRTGEKLLAMVRPTLDALAKLPRPAPEPTVTVTVTVELTTAEIDAIGKAHEHVRVHMAHEHSWEVRDAAMGGIGKVLAAARRA
ncbi:MAG TPA: hypothetical protein VLE97_11130 [Gaiellaceae bacterium]|nr:hypothetical protein [Gaiellaceae bacterium]